MKFFHHLLIVGAVAICALPVPISTARAQAAGPSIRSLHHAAWGEREGLRIGAGSRLARTPDGYLWLGSSSGLIRFDGVRFVTMDSTESRELVSTVVGETRPLLVDRNGVLWIARPDGAVVQYLDGSFRLTIGPDSMRPPIYRMTEDRAGNLWFMGGRRLFALRDGALVRPTLPAGVPDTGVISVVADTGRGLWIGTFTGGIWHVGAGEARHYSNPNTGFDVSVRPLLQDRDGTLWVWGDGLQSLRNDRWMRVRLAGNAIQAGDMKQASDGSLWIATRGQGVLRLQGNVLEQFTEDDGLTDVVTEEILVDEEGSVWASTDAGLDRFRAAPFQVIDRKNGLPFESPGMIYGDRDGSIWAAEASTGRVYHLDGGIIRRETGPVVATPVPTASWQPAVPIGAAHDGGIWLAGKGTGQLRLFRHGRLGPVVLDPARGDPAARQVVDDSTHTWVAPYGSGLGRLKDGRYMPISLPGMRQEWWIPSVTVDGRGHLWAAEAASPVLVELQGDTVVSRFDAASGLTGTVASLTAQGTDTIWGATVQGTLLRISNGRLDTLTVPAMARILPLESTVLIADGRDLWFASEGGVGKVALAALNARIDGLDSEVVTQFFDVLDGVPLGRLARRNAAPAFKATDGRIWFATPGGLRVVDPRASITSPVPPRVHIEEASVSGHRIPLNGALSIAPNPDRVEIRYTATDLRVPERVRIQYQLIGADANWVEGNATRTATYTQLRPGNYRFRVRAWNEDGVPSASEASVALRVAPSWYQAWWFRVALVLAVLGAGAGSLVAWLRARARRKVERLQAGFDAALAERTRLARELHDTLLQGFTGITLQLQGARHSIFDSPAEADATLARVLDLADVTLRDARLMVWDMRAPELDHHDLAQAIESAARTSTAGLDIDLHFAVAGPARRLPIATETAALRIGREAIVNAVKHAGASRIAVELVYEARRLRLSVLDNGRGLESGAEQIASNGGHWGIKGMRERATRAGGTLEIAGATGKGTTLSLDLPAE